MPSVLRPQNESVEQTRFIKGDPVYHGKIFKSGYSKKNVCGASLLHRADGESRTRWTNNRESMYQQ